MKRINVLILFLSICTITILTESCKKDKNENCPVGFIGNNCEDFDAAQVQALLEGGKTPIELVNGNMPLDSLYGKMYEGGLIFYLNTDDGTGLVAATENQSDGARWGCWGTDNVDLINVRKCPGMGNCVQPLPEDTFEGARIGDSMANTDAILAGCMDDGIAAKLCRALGSEWLLPSRGELNLMYTNLHVRGHGGFAADWYLSSSEYDHSNVWLQNFGFGSQRNLSKFDDGDVRAVRAF